MTASDFDRMSDAELAASAAGCMGWVYTDYRNPYYRAPNGDCVFFVNWRPAEDLNDASKLGAAFLAAWPGCHMGVRLGDPETTAVVYGQDWNKLAVIHANTEARARTVAVLKAWHELDAAKNESR